jgi:hypothetical protein
LKGFPWLYNEIKARRDGVMRALFVMNIRKGERKLWINFLWWLTKYLRAVSLFSAYR